MVADTLYLAKRGGIWDGHADAEDNIIPVADTLFLLLKSTWPLSSNWWNEELNYDIYGIL